MLWLLLMLLLPLFFDFNLFFFPPPPIPHQPQLDHQVKRNLLINFIGYLNQAEFVTAAKALVPVRFAW